ncbi:Peroxiredoxin [Saliniradius amylolyticus]|uniref:Glutathione-dependent peroxiredoxin n=1 Tax=Saliniradius amylolyticus TaxID=2183582 RepID=A0A2S2E739_9ALTE|nr:peroxiredoxin [Saliniradius amylolyticus]AWL13352.1 Peroxiredoxin [Saliniradius amylolyticus]
MIKQGDKIPAAELTVRRNDDNQTLKTEQLFSNKKVVLFAVPGAFTPTCSNTHLPGYVVKADDIKAKGVDDIICVSTNDIFVLNAWGEQQNADAITMAADGDASFTKALGLDMDTGSFGGVRSQRYSMLVENGEVKHLNVEAPGKFEVSDADTMLKLLSE